MILDGKLDDLLPSLSPEVRGPLEVFRKELFQHLERVAETAQRAVDEYKQANPNCTKKDYVNFAKSKYDPTVFSLHSKIFDGKASMKSIVDLIKQNCGVKSFEPARTAFELQHLNYYKSDMYWFILVWWELHYLKNPHNNRIQWQQLQQQLLQVLTLNSFE